MRLGNWFWLKVCSFVLLHGMILALPVYGQVQLQRVFIEENGVSTGRFGDISSFSNGEPLVLIERFTNFSQKGFSLFRLNKELQIVDSASIYSEYTISGVKCRINQDRIYVLANISNESSTNILFCVFDDNLDLISKKVSEDDLNFHYYDFFIHPDGGLSLIGYVIGDNGGTISNVGNWAMRWKSDGTIMWSKRLNFVSGLWGYGMQVPNGDIIGTGNNKFWSFDKDGKLNWSREYSDMRYCPPGRSLKNKLFFFSDNYSKGKKHGIKLDPATGSHEGMTQAVDIEQVTFSGKVSGENMILGSSDFNDNDSVALRLDYVDEFGKIYKTNYLDNYFGFAPTGSIQDACKYSYHLAADGTPYILGVAYRSGFFVLNLNAEGDFPCMVNKAGNVQGAPISEPGTANLSASDQSILFIDTDLEQELPARYRTELACYNCSEIAYRLPNDTGFCEGGELAINISNDVLSFEWADGNTDRDRIIDAAGTYRLTMYNTCDTLVDSITVQVLPLPQRSISTSTLEPLPGEPIQLYTNTPILDSMLWYWGDSLIGNGLNAQFLPTRNGQYAFRLHYSDGQCSNTDSILFDIRLIDWYLPDAFTPNDDGLNESWGPVGFGLKYYVITIFNRWGEIIYSEENGSWDGQYKGSPVVDGIYFFRMSYLTDDGERSFIQGKLHVLY